MSRRRGPKDALTALHIPPGQTPSRIISQFIRPSRSDDVKAQRTLILLSKSSCLTHHCFEELDVEDLLDVNLLAVDEDTA